MLAEYQSRVYSCCCNQFSIGYQISNKVTFTLNANNLLNGLPKWDLIASAAPSVTDKAASLKAANEINNPAKRNLY